MNRISLHRGSQRWFSVGTPYPNSHGQHETKGDFEYFV
ncbi:hypothetical protein AM1_4944 [Acaryochloris marina MBIC11017]|uniref:Uncharacterized protein n=1 Tax=Acaryochloris marina (strain MBIC 11017) TaxID=329726 RepID=B0C4N2_ACAM1|nr:hypothetical protein AM1_4944 [Acaryochloris marina MBIC11017]